MRWTTSIVLARMWCSRDRQRRAVALLMRLLRLDIPIVEPLRCIMWKLHSGFSEKMKNCIWFQSKERNGHLNNAKCLLSYQLNLVSSKYYQCLFYWIRLSICHDLIKLKYGNLEKSLAKPERDWTCSVTTKVRWWTSKIPKVLPHNQIAIEPQWFVSRYIWLFGKCVSGVKWIRVSSSEGCFIPDYEIFV